MNSIKEMENWLLSQTQAAGVALEIKNDSEVIAYLGLKKEAADIAQKNKETAQLWSRIFDFQYQQSPGDVEATFDAGVWKSSYNGKSIPEVEMKEWVSSTVQKLLPYCRPQSRVLEIGCGTGLIMYPLLSHIGEYIGIDTSAEVLKKLEAYCSQNLKSTKTKFFLGEASAIDSLTLEPVDIVIINSVAQYFPNADYLFKVLKGLKPLLKKDSLIFLGDMRSFPLQKHFYLDILLNRLEKNSYVDNLKKQLEISVKKEKECLYHPQLFHLLAQELEWISSAETELRDGIYANEMNKFRYDVLLHCHKKTVFPEHVTEFVWEPSSAIKELKEALVDSPEAFVLRRFPGEWTAELGDLLELLKNYPEHESISTFQAQAKNQNPKLSEIKEVLQKKYSRISVNCGLEKEAHLLTILCTHKNYDFLKPEASLQNFSDISNRLGFSDQSSSFKEVQKQFQKDFGDQFKLSELVSLSDEMFQILKGNKL